MRGCRCQEERDPGRTSGVSGEIALIPDASRVLGMDRTVLWDCDAVKGNGSRDRLA